MLSRPKEILNHAWVVQFPDYMIFSYMCRTKLRHESILLVFYTTVEIVAVLLLEANLCSLNCL